MLRHRNKTSFKKGQIPWNKGKKMPQTSGSKNPRWSGGEVKLHCTLCNKEYYRERCKVARSRFCSAACKAKFHHSGEKHWKWNGGSNNSRDKLKRSEEYRKWRLKVFQRDWFTCRMCGHRSVKSKAHGDKTSDIHAHHIIAISDNIRLCLKEGNGITLCVKCHRKTYGKEKLFATEFKEILNDYTLNIPKG